MVTDNPSIRIYVNKIENRITFKIKTRYYLELFMSKTIKLLGSTKSKIPKEKNGENVSHLETAEVILATRFNKIINKIQELSIHLFLINHLLNY